MAIELSTPGVGQLDEVVDALGQWQRDDAPIQLHPGDLGWYRRFGARASAAAIRTWRRDGTVLALGLLDGADVFRMTVAPQVWDDDELAAQVVADVSDPQRGVLPSGQVSVEAPNGTRVQDLLGGAGWHEGEPWTPLCHDLSFPVEQGDLRTKVIGPEHAGEYAVIVRSAFNSTRFTDERFHAMAGGPSFRDARSLLGYDDEGTVVAAITAWSAGAGRPGLIEPLGVHADHGGHGYGRAICRAAVAELAALGASGVLVCTRSANTGAVATYESAGFQRLPERLDRTRDA